MWVILQYCTTNYLSSVVGRSGVGERKTLPFLGSRLALQPGNLVFVVSQYSTMCVPDPHRQLVACALQDATVPRLDCLSAKV